MYNPEHIRAMGVMFDMNMQMLPIVRILKYFAARVGVYFIVV
jgi:hypothetical protein